MEFFTLITLLVLVVFFCAARVVYALWWRPKSLERQLRQQGVKGTSYKLIYGDKKEMQRMVMEAWSRPMALNHKIAPRVAPFFHHMVQKYGKVSLCWFEAKPRLIIADVELLRLVLTDKNGHFQKPPQNPLVDLLTLGVSNLEGQKWAKRRRLMTPAFHHDKIQGMVPAFSACCCDLIDRLEKMVSPLGSCELDMAPEFQTYSSDVIARVAFGSSYKEGKKIFELQKEQVVLVLEAYHAIYVPGFRYVPTKKNRRRYEIDNEIKTMLRDMIHKKTEAMRQNADDLDLLGLLLQCKEDTDSEMTIEDIIEECKLFYFAGQETTANWLTWTIIVLSMHPNWQEKSREEVLRVCGKRTPELHDINHLKTVSMVLHEVLRLYPPVTALYRQSIQKTNVGGLSIPAGVEMFLPTMMLHQDAGYWGKDVEEFNPERFAEGVSKASKDQVAFYAFGWGPRFCLGQSFAMLEAKLGLAMMLQRFSFELSPSYTHAPHTVITMQPQYGAPLILHKI